MVKSLLRDDEAQFQFVTLVVVPPLETAIYSSPCPPARDDGPYAGLYRPAEC
jgi:hypothetical protein